eukprot:3686773-Rhodomonas_salina.1
MGFPVLSPSSFTVFSDQQLECHCADVQGTSTEEGQMRGSVGTNGTAVLATWHEGDTMATIQVQATVGLHVFPTASPGSWFSSLFSSTSFALQWIWSLTCEGCSAVLSRRSCRINRTPETQSEVGRLRVESPEAQKRQRQSADAVLRRSSWVKTRREEPERSAAEVTM